MFPSQRHQARQAAKLSKQTPAHGDKSDRPASLLYALRAVSLAWDRSRVLRKVHRQAAAGDLVICDRYPADQAGGTDGPRLNVDDSKQSWLFNCLARYEQRLYAENAPPDVALRIHVSVETAKQRNQRRAKTEKHGDEGLEIRHRQVRDWKNTGTKVVRDINSEASLEQTILSVKEAIWESL